MERLQWPKKTRLTMLDMDLDQYYKLQEKYANNL